MVIARPADDELRGRFAAALDDFLDGQRPGLLAIGAELAPVHDAMRDFVAGGKRLRPSFCYWGWRGAGRPDDPGVVAAAASLELLQGCALVHDDLIDGSDTRRGSPSVHRRFGKLHAREGWLGSDDAFGSGAAILIGDLFLAWSEEMYRRSGLDTAALAAGGPVYAAMRTEVMAGQYLDLIGQVSGAESAETALRVVRYKTAKYTIERPLHLGAALAGALDALGPVYTAYGLPLGVAFQLRDDVLGVFGDPAETGKPAGDDLREGKRTVLAAETLRRAAPPAAAEFRRCLGDPALGPDAVDRLREIIEGCGALAACERHIETYAAEATAALDSPALDPVSRSALAGLAVAATVRRT
ncbi:polyprenyl synthetase family protein [Allonocardiopsis opalescens]|nr:polyprenyl synthetase family protein [Allonocardiopsis opalescens]